MGEWRVSVRACGYRDIIIETGGEWGRKGESGG